MPDQTQIATIPGTLPRPNTILISINGHPHAVPSGTLVAAALLSAHVPARTSISGEPRTALCGMGICYECRATIDGIPHQRTCLIPCNPGMQIDTQ